MYLSIQIALSTATMQSDQKDFLYQLRKSTSFMEGSKTLLREPPITSLPYIDFDKPHSDAMHTHADVSHNKSLEI